MIIGDWLDWGSDLLGVGWLGFCRFAIICYRYRTCDCQVHIVYQCRNLLCHKNSGKPVC